MAHPKIIALIGIDGAGKSTQASELAEWLAAGGTRAIFCKNPGGRLRLDRLAHRLGRANAVDLLGVRTLSIVESVVRWLTVTRAVLRSRIWRKVAVMDRYLDCQYAVLRARQQEKQADLDGSDAGESGTGESAAGTNPGPPTGAPPPRSERLARAMYSVLPRPDLVCFLAVTPKAAQKRIEGRGYDSEKLSYLVALDAAYRSLPEAEEFVTIDADGSVPSVQSALRDVVAALPLNDASVAPPP